jgi:hypothetical protein
MQVEQFFNVCTVGKKVKYCKNYLTTHQGQAMAKLTITFSLTHLYQLIRVSVDG